DGHAIVKTVTGLQVVDRSGQLAAIPADATVATVVAGNRLRFRRSADGPWGLYDFTSGQVVAEPAFTSIGVFIGGHAVAKADGKAGVIDKNGDWLLAPEYSAITALNGAVWLVQKAGDDGLRAIVDNSGQVLLHGKQLQAATGADR